MKINVTKAVLLAAALLAFTAALPVQAGGNLKNPGILPPQSTPGDMTFGEWAADWWQWAVSIPTPGNPLVDTTGQYAGVDQEGSVWFLAGVWGANAPVTRTCTIPAGKMLFFPVVNIFYVGWGWTPEDDVPAILASWREEMRTWLNGKTDVGCEIDGRPVNNLTTYREESPPFPMVFPEDNLFGWPELAEVTDALAIDTGYYLMLAPLKPGPHTIHFHADTMDVTYHLTVK